jgi:DNA-binding CsgD family transcriptional regulator
MRIDAGLPTIENAFLAAALDPSLWNEAMDVAATEMGAQACALFPIRWRPEAPLAFSPNIIEMAEFYAKQGWHLRDERNRGIARLKAGQVVVDFDLIDNDEIQRHPYYQDFLGRFGYRWFAGVPLSTSDDLFTLSVQRKTGAGPFKRSEQATLRDWGRRLSTAARFAGAVGMARNAGACDMLEKLGMAAILLNNIGQVVQVNQSAERLNCKDIAIRNRRIDVADREASVELGRALHQVLAADAPVQSSGPVPIPRRDARPLVLYAISLEKQDLNPFAPAKALVMIYDLENRSVIKAHELQRIFSLTPAEAELAALLSTGENLTTAADRFKVTAETARKRLKAIFEKTGVHRQGALVALVAQLAKRV